MVLHTRKSTAMLISRPKFVRRFHELTIEGTSINFLSSTSCLDAVLDDQTSLTPHLKETLKLFARKLNLPTSLDLLPAAHLETLCFKVIFISVIHGMLI